MKKICLFFFIILLFPACAEKHNGYEKEGKRYGITEGAFSGRWWNYYERGVSFTEGEFFNEAEKDFLQAIELRQDDKWRARTYGMHFVNYFPHRELGIVYYRLQKYPEAVRELEASLRTAENAKAKYFLNLARKAILAQTGRDTLKPTISINQPLPNTITNRFSMDIAGVVTDDSYVSKVILDQSPFLFELAAPRVDFEQRVLLKEGRNSIRVRAEDLSGKSIEKNLDILVDRRGPVVGVNNIVPIGQNKRFKLFVADDNEIVSLMVGTRDILLDQGTKEIELSEEVGTDRIVIQAKDIAGNLTIAELVWQEKEISKQRYPLLAALDQTVHQSSAGRQSSGQMEYTNWLRVARAADSDPPTLRLKLDATRGDSYADAFLLEGRALDSSNVRSLTINGEQILAREGQQVFFTVLKPLQVGENRFFIQATDSFGNTSSREVVITRKVAKVKQIGSRMGLGILPFDQRGDKPPFAEGLYEKLIAAFLQQQRFNVVERQKLEVILQELKLSETPLVDPASAVKVGRIMAADSILIGTVLATSSSLEVITRLIDTETSVVLAAHDVFSEVSALQPMNDLLSALAFKYKRDFPLLEGIIIDIRPDNILIDLGRKHKIKEHTKVICFREAERIKHPVTDQVLGVDSQEVGLAKIIKTYPDYSTAEVIRHFGDLRIKDRVITK